MLGLRWNLPLTLCWAGVVSICASQPASAQSPAREAESRPVTTQPASQSSRPSAPSELACRMARADAACKLAAKIQRLPLGESATVADLLDRLPLAEHALKVLLLKRAAAAAPRPDGDACEVTLELSRSTVASILRTIPDHYYQGKRPLETVLNQLAEHTDRQVLSATGTGTALPIVPSLTFISYRPGEDCFSRAGRTTREFWLSHATDGDRRQAEQDSHGDSMDRLAEQAKQLPAGNVTLEQFVTQFDPEASDLRRFLQAARIQGIYYYASAPVIEVRVSVSRRTIYASLKGWLHSRGASSDSIRLLETLIVAAGDEKISELGIAAVKADKLKKSDPTMLASVAIATFVPRWTGRTLRQTGIAFENETSTTDAVRAAERDARCALLGRIDSLPVGPARRIADLAREDEELSPKLLALVLAAEPVSRPVIGEDGSVEVTLELPLRSLWRMILHHQRMAPPARSPQS